MPIYEYKCTACGHIFDVIQKVSDAPLNTCPECGDKLEKCVSSPALQFKGSGFYITDYPNKSTAASGGKKAEAKKTDKRPKTKKTAPKKKAD
ncbi:MAG: FmdB family zinc ribbon protein [Leptospirillia bacterium]